MGASSFTSAPMMFALVTVRMAPSSCKKLTPPASGFRFRGCRWIQAVKVDCQVNRHICLAQPIGQFLQTGEIELVNIGMAGGKLEFFPIAAADTELVDAAIAQKVMAAAQHTGMTELCAEIVIPQVGVSVKWTMCRSGYFSRQPAQPPA